MGQYQETVLLVDDDDVVLESTLKVLEQEGLGRCLKASTGMAALAAAEETDLDLVLLDLGLPDLSGDEVLTRLRSSHPEVPVVIVTALVDVEMAVRCMALGAYDYVVKGGDPGRLVASSRRALESRRKDVEIASIRERMLSVDLKNPEHFAALVTVSERMRVLFRFIEAVARSDEPILLQGETGTGKELFAHAVHKASGTRGPFVASNLGGLDDFMVSDTLFGHVKGAYTGADDARKGLISSAAGGTLFLDEIGDLSPVSQVKLLRFLENREYYPLGSDVARKSDARIVAATNHRLEEAVEAGRFRRDLLYRLSTYGVQIPPLRERPEDIPLLCAHFQRSLAPEQPIAQLTSGAMALLRQYPFPGNVRELRGILLRGMAVAEGQTIDKSIVESLVKPALQTQDSGSQPEVPPYSAQLPTIRQAIENLVSEAMARTKGHQTLAANLLGITPQALSKRLKKRGEDSQL